MRGTRSFTESNPAAVTNRSQTAVASRPDKRTIAIAASPEAVAVATIVSKRSIMNNEGNQPEKRNVDAMELTLQGHQTQNLQDKNGQMIAKRLQVLSNNDAE